MLQTGDILKYLRTENKLTQTELAEALGLKLSAIQKYESGAIQNIKLDTLRKLCEMFSVSPYVFVFPETVRSVERAVHFHLPDEDAIRLLQLNSKGIEKIREYANDIYLTGKYFDKE